MRRRQRIQLLVRGRHLTALPDSVADLTSRGLAVFPISAGLRQAPRGWHTQASSKPGQAWPAVANIGIGCRASVVVVIDLDRKRLAEDGVAAFGELCTGAVVPWPQTFTVATPNQGLHLYFTAPTGRTVASAIAQPAPGIDIRAPGATVGGYVIGPGSTVNGRRYRTTNPHPIIALPVWLATLLRPARTSGRAPPLPKTAPVAFNHGERTAYGAWQKRDRR